MLYDTRPGYRTIGQVQTRPNQVKSFAKVISFLHKHKEKQKCLKSAGCGHRTVVPRVSQKIQKSEFWNATYPSGFHRLDEQPEKISAL